MPSLARVPTQSGEMKSTLTSSAGAGVKLLSPSEAPIPHSPCSVHITIDDSLNLTRAKLLFRELNETCLICVFVCEQKSVLSKCQF